MGQRKRELNRRGIGLKSSPQERNAIATALYARLSVEDEDGESIDTQLSFLGNYVEDYPEFDVRGIYADNGFTGTNFDRPDFQRMLEDAKAGRIQCIIVKDLSRFGRSYLEVGDFVENVFPRIHVRLIAINDEFDSNRPEDVNSLVFPLKNLINTMYARDISKKIRAANKAKREKGTTKITLTVYGFEVDRENNNYFPVEDKAAVVRAIFRWYRNGMSTVAIQKRLNLMNVPTPRMRTNQDGNASWGDSSIRNMLRDSTYIGVFERGHYCTHPEDCKDILHIEKHHEPLVACEDFYRVREILQSRKVRTGEGCSVESILHGKIRCRNCGGGMRYVCRKTNKYFQPDKYTIWKCPTCDNSINDNLAVFLISEQIKQMAKLTIHADAIAETVQKEIRAHKREVLNFEHRIDQLKEEMGSVYEKYLDGLLDGNQLKEKNKAIYDEIEICTDKRTQMEKRIEQQEESISTNKKRAKYFSGLLQDFELNRSIVEKLIETVYVGEAQNLEIQYKTSDLFQGEGENQK